jgi:hypothetical protein
LVNLVTGAAGLAFVAWAVGSNPAWFDRHVLPNYCPRHAWTRGLETASRWALACAGVFVLVVVRPRLAGRVAEAEGGAWRRIAVRTVAPLLLALVAADVFLRVREARHHIEEDAGLPPMRIDDSRNLAPVPSRANEWDVEGRTIRYAINSQGNRAPSVAQVADLEAPTILFIGESIAQGWGVAYDDTYAAVVGRATGVQTVNLAVTGFSSDQAYLRLLAALPTFAKPIAIVTLVVPVQLERTVSDRRQRLVLVDGRLELAQASTSPLLTSPLRKLLPYHSDEAIALTRAILGATSNLARERGARALFVFTNFGPPCLTEDDGMSGLERSLFSGLGVTHVRVDITPELMIHPPREVHPNEKGHGAIAAAIVDLLRDGTVANP